MKPRSVLVTGGCGFIGLNLIKFLIHKGYQNIRILDNLSIGTKASIESLLSELGTFSKKETKNQTVFFLSPQPSALSFSNDSLLNSEVELVIGDIRDRQTCNKATEGIDAVVHLAAHAGVIPSIKDPFFDFETNALGTLNLLREAVNNSVNRFIFASSHAPLGEHDPPLSEASVPQPLSPYGASKLSCEGYCSAFYGSYGLKTVVLRFSNVYGQYCLRKESVVAKLIKDGILKRELTVYGDGVQTRDFIHVNDLSQAIHICLSGLEKEQLTNNGKLSGEIFHLGTGKETSILDLAKLVKGLFDDEIKISFAPERKGEIRSNYSDIVKAKRILGFCPQISLKDGVEAVYKWFINLDTEDIKQGIVLSGSE